jgi:cytochrome c biogenesis protein CcdA/thiol-disulfide isomerase/thioredoxin
VVLLILFGFLAGAGTALSPCVLPVLPIALSAGATGGRRRPLGIVVGLTASFTFATVALVYVLDALGLPDTLLRTLAIAVLLAFGVTLLIPSLATRLEGRLSGVAARLGARPASASGDGFRSGLLVGASLGLVYAPCAGPVLAGVITVSASQPFTAGRLAVALAYGVGSAVVLYLLMIGGRRLTAPLAKRSGALQMAMGAVMIVVALAMLNDYDLRFQSAIAKDLPAFLVNPTQSLEQTAAAQRGLADVRGRSGSKLAAATQQPAADDDAGTDAAPAHGSAAGRLHLKDYGRAPDFTDTQQWFNTADGRPLTMAELRGRVVLIDFWTYSCINCLRTLPYLKAWDARYRSQGLTIVGVHSPEFPFEKEAGNVAAAIEREGIRYPVVQDNDLGTWDAYGNQYWPAHYFVDARGHVRYAHFGEGGYEHSEAVVRALLAEAGRRVGSARARAQGVAASLGVTTPESYLGAMRAERFANGSIFPGRQDYGDAPDPQPDMLSYGGVWNVAKEQATAAGPDAALELRFGARRVFLVLGSPGRPRRMRVLLDGRPIPDALAGADVHGGVATISSQRLYDLVDLSTVGKHLLTLRPDDGVQGYAFTFG